jgi:cell shape-determining protein MreC
MRLHVRSSKRLLLTALMAAAGVAYVLGPGFAARLRGATDVFLVPVGDLGMRITTGVAGRLEGPKVRDLTPAEIRQILDENERLQASLSALEQRHADLRAQSRRLSQLYDQFDGFECELIAARVVAADSLGYGKGRLVDQGRRSGVAVGDVVTTRQLLTDRTKALPEGLVAITSSALVGRVLSSGAFTARLQLLTDRGYILHAHLLRQIHEAPPRQIMVSDGGAAQLQPLSPENNLPIDVLARGDGDGGLVIRDVRADHNILPGDWLVTRHTDPELPVQIRVGEVVSADTQDENPHFVTVHVRPWADLATLQEVYLLIPRGRAGG